MIARIFMFPPRNSHPLFYVQNDTSHPGGVRVEMGYR